MVGWRQIMMALGSDEVYFVPSAFEAEWAVVTSGEPFVGEESSLVVDALSQSSCVLNIITLFSVTVESADVYGTLFLMVQEHI